MFLLSASLSTNKTHYAGRSWTWMYGYLIRFVFYIRDFYIHTHLLLQRRKWKESLCLWLYFCWYICVLFYIRTCLVHHVPYFSDTNVFCWYVCVRFLYMNTYSQHTCINLIHNGYICILLMYVCRVSIYEHLFVHYVSIFAQYICILLIYTCILFLYILTLIHNLYCPIRLYSLDIYVSNFLFTMCVCIGFKQ